jgi:hypothetical protein
MKVFVYPESPYHTLDCLFPPELPNRYVNTTGYWWQRMLEPVVHHQFLHSPILTSDPSSASLFVVPHYSRMCSGLDGGERWRAIPAYLGEHGGFFRRYSGCDHFVMHSVPHYGDKPADLSVFRPTGPIVGLLDFKWRAIRDLPWTTSRSLVVPFITLPAPDTSASARGTSVFVAMSTSKKGLKAASASLRQRIQEQLANVSGSEIFLIDRQEYATFRAAIDALPERMGRARLCICPPGDAPSSKRFYDAISYFCIPYILTDYWFLPYEDVLIDYEKSLKQLWSRKVHELGRALNAMSIPEVNRMRDELKVVRRRFTWDYELKPRTGEALWTLSWALYDKIRMLKPYLNNEMTGDDEDPEFQFTV